MIVPLPSLCSRQQMGLVTGTARLGKYGLGLRSGGVIMCPTPISDTGEELGSADHIHPPASRREAAFLIAQ